MSQNDLLRKKKILKEFVFQNNAHTSVFVTSPKPWLVTMVLNRFFFSNDIFKIVKTIVIDNGFRLKVKTVVDN